MRYVITWTIECWGGTPREAAEAALETMRDHESTATCFVLIDEDGKSHDVDLSLEDEDEDEGEEGQCEILCDESRGIYIPKAFAEMYGDMLVPEEGYDPKEDIATLLKGPGGVLDEDSSDDEGDRAEQYWYAMEEIENKCLLSMDGKLWDIEQNGDLWAYEHGKRRPDGHDGE